ncbi:MAG: tRNA(Ile)-lysidine synthetase-like protein [Acidobacteriaceae bacterium]|nr:tRNA(Ile)-lysidine synthetase-like protein [Acidobacteriaceae bacterium]
MNRPAQSVAAYIRKHDLLRPGDRVGIAVSAGADSVALLRLMLDLRDELGIVLSVVHFNHKLRGADSDTDEQFVRELAESHGLEFIADNYDVKAYSADKKLSLEAAAREVRYEFFRRALQSSVNRIATAHTLDEQAETVLLKLARGAGTRGLAGIYPKVAVSRQPSGVSPPEPKPKSTTPSSQLTIIRPLLGTRRSQLRSYLAEIDQSWREDSSNEDLRHTRNRVRHEILPRLEQQVNPGVCEVLAETAEIARAEEGYWAKEIARYLPQVWSQDKQGGILQLKFFASLPLALRRRLVRAAAETLGMALEFRHVEEILDQQSDGNSSVLPREWIVTRHGDELRFRKALEAASDYQYELPVPGKITVIEAGIELETFVVNGARETRRYNPQHLVDSRFAKGPLVVRNWRAGERFWPAHTKEPKKIKKLLQDRHITGDAKQRWPVIASGDEIIWIRGLGVRRDFQSNGPTGVAIKEVAIPIGQQ